MFAFSLIIFGIVVIMGIILAFGHFLGSRPPLFSIGMIHGIVALVGLIALIITSGGGVRGSADRTSLTLFVVALIIGFVIFWIRLRRKVLPKVLILVHGLFAVIGYVFLVWAQRIVH